MRSSRALILALTALGFGVLGFYYYSTVQPLQDAVNTDEPAQIVSAERSGLQISVAGQANGIIEIELFDDVAPLHVERIKALATSGAYDNVVFHRVIDGFMAQTGDVQFGQSGSDMRLAGTGASDMPNLTAEFSDETFTRGVVGMARSSSPDSANSQFFIMFAPAAHLDGKYTIVGKVVSGLDILDQIKLGEGANGAIIGEPDMMKSVTVTE